MKVKLILKYRNGKYGRYKDRITMKQAKELAKKYNKDLDIIEIFTMHFSGWHWRRNKTLLDRGYVKK